MSKHWDIYHLDYRRSLHKIKKNATSLIIDQYHSSHFYVSMSLPCAPTILNIFYQKHCQALKRSAQVVGFWCPGKNDHLTWAKRVERERPLAVCTFWGQWDQWFIKDWTWSRNGTWTCSDAPRSTAHTPPPSVVLKSSSIYWALLLASEPLCTLAGFRFGHSSDVALLGTSKERLYEKEINVSIISSWWWRWRSRNWGEPWL